MGSCLIYVCLATTFAPTQCSVLETLLSIVAYAVRMTDECWTARRSLARRSLFSVDQGLFRRRSDTKVLCILYRERHLCFQAKRGVLELLC